LNILEFSSVKSKFIRSFLFIKYFKNEKWLKISYLQFKDKRIYYELKCIGSSRVLIFIHGSGSTSKVWKYQFDLDVNHDLIALDLPSHGKSSKFSKLSLELYVNVLEALIKQLNYTEVILCGHSLGGAIIQSFYFKNPNLVNRLILVGSGARLRVSPVILDSLKSDYDEFLNSLPFGAFSRKTSNKIVSTYIKETSKVGQEVTYQDFAICDKFDTMALTSSIKVPILIIVGKDDKLTPVKYANYYKEKASNSELFIIEKAGHMVMIEQPEKFNEIIKKSIDS